MNSNLKRQDSTQYATHFLAFALDIIMRLRAWAAVLAPVLDALCGAVVDGKNAAIVCIGPCGNDARGWTTRCCPPICHRCISWLLRALPSHIGETRSSFIGFLCDYGVCPQVDLPPLARAFSARDYPAVVRRQPRLHNFARRMHWCEGHGCPLSGIPMP